MSQCDNCNGGGLIGQGDRPWAKEGHVTTCGKCNGTGQISDEAVASSAPAEVPAEPVNAPESSTVDSGNLSAGSPDGSGDGSNQSTEPVAPLE